MAPRKDLPTFSRTRDGIAKLEEQILPKRQSRLFELVIDDQSPLSQGEQIEAFRPSGASSRLTTS
jgi:hypothetical protein